MKDSETKLLLAMSKVVMGLTAEQLALAEIQGLDHQGIEDTKKLLAEMFILLADIEYEKEIPLPVAEGVVTALIQKTLETAIKPE
jgi:hypothetical protein